MRNPTQLRERDKHHPCYNQVTATNLLRMQWFSGISSTRTVLGLTFSRIPEDFPSLSPKLALGMEPFFTYCDRITTFEASVTGGDHTYTQFVDMQISYESLKYESALKRSSAIQHYKCGK